MHAAASDFSSYEKKHDGSPARVERLTLRVNEHLDYDPYTPEFVNQTGYSDYFRNTCINSGIMHQASISQLFVIANPYALVMDHSYGTAADPIDSYLRTSRVTEITQFEVNAVQTLTIGQCTNLQWKTERKKRLSASQFGRICKMTEPTNAQRLAKSSLIHEDIQTAAINHGKSY